MVRRRGARPLRFDPIDSTAQAEDRGGRLRCPFCSSYDVRRLFLASVRLDSCECTTCSARWDEEPDTGIYRGRGARGSIVVPRER